MARSPDYCPYYEDDSVPCTSCNPDCPYNVSHFSPLKTLGKAVRQMSSDSRKNLKALSLTEMRLVSIREQSKWRISAT